MQPHIYLDMDGVMVDWVGEVLRTFDSDLKEEDIDTWKIEDKLGISEDFMWSRLWSRFWWEGLAPYPWATPLFEMLTAYGQVTYLTSPGKCPSAASGKLAWIQQRHGPGFTDWIFTNHKEHVSGPGRILIDDSEKFCEAWEKAGGYAILVPQYWNRSRTLRQALNDHMVPFIENQLRRALGA
jgi:5'(3')-deoxyribonucleotidase